MEEALDADKLIGSELGAYRIVRKLGAGGMGVVFEAVHREIGQRVAIKLLHGHIARDGKTFQRFENEARAIGRIKHPGLVNIFGYEHTSDDAAYIVMEFLQGEALYERIEKLRAESKRMPLAQAISIVRQVASTLTEAHANGIVHCDLKPENIFLVRDELVEYGERAKVLDFGIAKFVAGDGGRKTTVGLILGTPIYMSPEQCEGRDGIGDKTDVYSLGVMFYELLAGEPPFRSDSSAALMRKHMLVPPPPIAEKAPGVPPGIAALLERMLAKEASDRPSMKELASGLANGVAEASSRRARPKSLVYVSAVLGLLAVLSIAAMTTRSRRTSIAAPQPAATSSAVPHPSRQPEPPTVEAAPAPKSAPAHDEGKSSTPSSKSGSKRKRVTSSHSPTEAAAKSSTDAAKPEAPTQTLSPIAPLPVKPAVEPGDAAPAKKREYAPLR